MKQDWQGYARRLFFKFEHCSMAWNNEVCQGYYFFAVLTKFFVGAVFFKQSFLVV